MNLQEIILFDLGAKVTRNIAQFPLHVIYASTKFEIATSYGLGEDTITCTRNVTDGRTTDRLWYENNIPYFSNEKAGILSYFFDPEVQRAWHMLILSPICYR